jgi:hypothetical protein
VLDMYCALLITLDPSSIVTCTWKHQPCHIHLRSDNLKTSSFDWWSAWLLACGLSTGKDSRKLHALQCTAYSVQQCTAYSVQQYTVQNVQQFVMRKLGTVCSSTLCTVYSSETSIVYISTLCSVFSSPKTSVKPYHVEAPEPSSCAGGCPEATPTQADAQ